VAENWEIQQMDVKGAYLNGKLKEEILWINPKAMMMACLGYAT